MRRCCGGVVALSVKLSVPSRVSPTQTSSRLSKKVAHPMFATFTLRSSTSRQSLRKKPPWVSTRKRRAAESARARRTMAWAMSRSRAQTFIGMHARAASPRPWALKNTNSFQRCEEGQGAQTPDRWQGRAQCQGRHHQGRQLPEPRCACRSCRTQPEMVQQHTSHLARRPGKLPVCC